MNTEKSARIPWAFRDLAGIFFPQRCPVCDKALPFGPRSKAPLGTQPDPFFHEACLSRLVFIQDPYCLRCGRPLSDEGAEYCPACRKRTWTFKQNLPLLLYNDAARFSISHFKYHGRQEFALPYARLFMERHGEELGALHAEALIPVPIHKSRLRKRGYNQAALLAYELEKLSGIPCREDILIRSKHTGAQKELNRKERLSNMQNAFRLKTKPEGIQTVILVDDIFTTGSTLESCSRVLKKAGIRQIYTITLSIAAE